MGWATQHIEALKQGNSVKFTPPGNSMSGKIESGQLVTVAPTGEQELRIGDIVLCRVNAIQYLHLIKAISGKHYQIGNNRGRINGWTSRQNIFGVVTQIQDCRDLNNRLTHATVSRFSATRATEHESRHCDTIP